MGDLPPVGDAIAVGVHRAVLASAARSVPHRNVDVGNGVQKNGRAPGSAGQGGRRMRGRAAGADRDGPVSARERQRGQRQNAAAAAAGADERPARASAADKQRADVAAGRHAERPVRAEADHLVRRRVEHVRDAILDGAGLDVVRHGGEPEDVGAADLGAVSVESRPAVEDGLVVGQAGERLRQGGAGGRRRGDRRVGKGAGGRTGAEPDLDRRPGRDGRSVERERRGQGRAGARDAGGADVRKRRRERAHGIADDHDAAAAVAADAVGRSAVVAAARAAAAQAVRAGGGPRRRSDPQQRRLRLQQDPFFRRTPPGYHRIA